MSLASDQLPIPFPEWELDPTAAMQRGEQQVHQCAWCGAVIITVTSSNPDEPDRHKLGRKPCPSCERTDGWWSEVTPITHSLAGWTFTPPAAELGEP